MPKQATNGPRETRAEQKERTRARILECALTAFAEKGFEGATVREIAAAAGVNHGMITYHFTDKDNLWREAVTFLFGRMHKELEAPPEEKDMTEFEKLKSWIRRYVRYCARHPEHARIIVQESIRDSSRLRWAVKKFIKPDHEKWARAQDRQVKMGIYPDVPRYSISYSLVAVCQYVFMLSRELKLVFDVDVDDPEKVEQHADAVIALFFTHAAPSEMREPQS